MRSHSTESLTFSHYIPLEYKKIEFFTFVRASYLLFTLPCIQIYCRIGLLWGHTIVLNMTTRWIVVHLCYRSFFYSLPSSPLVLTEYPKPTGDWGCQSPMKLLHCLLMPSLIRFCDLQKLWFWRNTLVVMGLMSVKIEVHITEKHSFLYKWPKSMFYP